MAKLICAGHASCDIPIRTVNKTIFDVDTTFVKNGGILTGGDALNVAVSLCKLGVGDETLFLSVVGDDTYGKLTINYLEQHGINTSGIIVKPKCVSMVTVILIDDQNERHFLVDGDAGRHITTDDIIANITADTKYLHIGSFMSLDMIEHDNMAKLFSYAKERKIHTSFDVTYDETGEWLGKIEAGLPFTDIFFASYDEAVSISGGLKEPKQIANFFKKFGIGMFVLKLGNLGCYATDYNEVIELPTYTHMPVVDTTGAGDAFVAAFMYGVLRGFNMEQCCLLGNINGTLSVGKLGANTGTGTITEIKQFVKQHGALSLDADEFINML